MIGIDASHTIHAGEKFRSRAIAIAFGEPGAPRSIPRHAHGIVAFDPSRRRSWMQVRFRHFG
jgi:hypothetical protein